jgi:hypothetical protein
MRLGLLFVLFCFTSVTAQKIDRLKEILPMVDRETLVVFDIHNTLLRTTQQLGSRAWAYSLVQELVAKGIDLEEAKREALRRSIQVMSISKMQLVEPDTAEIVHRLQEAGIPVIALTGSPFHLSSTIPTQLQICGIDLGRSCPLTGRVEIPSSSGAQYENGIIYGNNNHKGEVLRAFLTMTGLRPTRILYVDDYHREIERVQETLEELAIDSLCIQYDAAIKAESPLEPAVVKMQWETMGKILSDEQARHLLSMPETIK